MMMKSKVICERDNTAVVRTASGEAESLGEEHR